MSMHAAGSRLHARHRPRAARELVRLDAHALQHGDEEIRQRLVVLLVEGEMLAVLEAAAGEDEREIRRVVGVRVGEVRAVEEHRVVEQRAVGFLHARESIEQAREAAELRFLDLLQLGDLRLVVAVMRERVRLVFHAGNVWRDEQRAEVNGDDARRSPARGAWCHT